MVAAHAQLENVNRLISYAIEGATQRVDCVFIHIPTLTAVLLSSSEARLSPGRLPVLMRLILLGGRIMALIGRVVGVGAAGEPGGDIVMVAIASLNSIYILFLSSHNPKHLRGPKPVDERRKDGRCTIDGQSKRSPPNRVIRYDTWAKSEEGNFIRNVETKS
jgi:hypothetical protein